MSITVNDIKTASSVEDLERLLDTDAEDFYLFDGNEEEFRKRIFYSVGLIAAARVRRIELEGE